MPAIDGGSGWAWPGSLPAQTVRSLGTARPSPLDLLRKGVTDGSDQCVELAQRGFPRTSRGNPYGCTGGDCFLPGSIRLACNVLGFWWARGGREEDRCCRGAEA